MGTSLSTRAVAAAAAVLIALTLGPAALAAPSESDIATVQESADAATRRIADVEVDLARNSAIEDAAILRVQETAEDYNTSQQGLADAEAEALAAQETYTASVQELEEARSVVAGIAMSAYRSGAGVNQLAMLLEADGITEALNSANTYSVLGERAEQAQQNFAAATVATNLARERAEVAVAASQAAAAAVDAVYAASKLEAEVAQAEADAARAERDALIVELADYRNTTVAMERERQDQIDADRRERDNRVARVAAEQAATDEANREQATAPAPPATQPSTTQPPTTQPPTTQPPVTPEPTTQAPTTAPPATTEPPTTEPSTTRPPTTAPPTTAPPTTSPPTTSPPTTAPPTTRPTPTPTTQPTPTPTSTPTSPPKPKPKPTPTTPPPAPKPPKGSGAGGVALSWAKTQLGKPYVWGSAGPNSYDCSGLTSAAFRQAGVSLPRNSAAQYNVGSKVALADLKAGDLIFYSNNGSGSGIYHVGFYAGGGMRLHAPSPGKSVELVSMYYTNILPYGVRL